MFTKVLVANRGEIAVRVMRALNELGIGTVGVYSEVDRAAVHVEEADEAYLIGPGPPAESYLKIEKLLETADKAGAEAIHPGYGFLAENAAFAKACSDAGLVFIGPPAGAIEAMGSKTRSRKLMQEAGVPIVPGTTEAVESVDEAEKLATDMGFPVAIKAAGGGGGKGFRIAQSEDQVQKAFEGASREGEKFFSDPTVYIEKYLTNPRHVEIQVLADDHGNVVHLGERDCSVQRRHQKLIEETPAPGVDENLRRHMGEISIAAAKAVNYRSAGTVEGLLTGNTESTEYYFLEMNTRVQVEHTITEMATGIDIVHEQIRIAAGQPLTFSQKDVQIRGAAIECRINAEAAHKKFAPAPGSITAYHEPGGPGVRVDSGVTSGSEVTPLYDPLIAKLVVWDRTREAATRRMLRALGEYQIEGLKTLIPFHKAILQSEQWRRGETCRDLIEDSKWLKGLAPEKPSNPPAAAGEKAEVKERSYQVEVNGKRFNVKVVGEAPNNPPSNTATPPFRPRSRRESNSPAAPAYTDGASETITSPLQGTVLRVTVEKGQQIEEGTLVCVIEAMKMENEITAHRTGKIAELAVSEGGSIGIGDIIAKIE